ncbi:cell division protein FtsI (penicillin-binding protein 3) [Isoptericola sp. CG 20/1183]|uniref:Cell division protein FtsI (Penicillin-binding protein 3) n=1 Tax=Isoptericola halotolerans TaxID=300560 RepID=A0ABX5ECL2_9MICO|nr:cell division protein FtsI (penicillin-binding protein 3) [Isoptericola halotolerans]PRZ06149.1 cell division protein FtsI (penicillin-binding protein 3) [Isoptericola sp. CG 20/1183]
MSATRPARSRGSGPVRTQDRGVTRRPTGGGRTARRPASTARPTTRTPTRRREAGDPARRQRWLIVLAAIVLTVFVGRLVQVQVVQGAALASDAQQDRLATQVTPAHRGNILDRNGTVLATSVDRYTIIADQDAIQNFRGNSRHDAEGEPVQDGALGIAQLLGPVLGESKETLAAKLNGEDRYVKLKEGVVPEVQRAVTELDLRAYIPTELSSKRTYPSGAVAGPILGYVNSAMDGQGGVEAAYDDVLAGTDGTRTYERGRDGVPIPGSEIESVAAVPGQDVCLTIDADVQWKAEELLDDAVRDTGASYAMAIVHDVRTGEVVAMADSGDVDPNDRSTSAVADGSRAVNVVFEPGSTGKVIAMAAALEGGYWKPTDQFEVPDTFTVDGETFRDSHPHPVERWTLAGILAQSSNTGTVMMGQEIPWAVRYDYLRKFGLGERTALGLPGESAGLLPDENIDEIENRTPYTVLFGQGVAVSAMQATQVFSTIANGGVHLPARLLAGTQTTDGVRTDAEPGEGEQVVSEETADDVLTMMEAATSEDGTGSAAQVPGYRVAGKTGTAQMFEGGGTTYVASYIGVAPADDPRYTVSVFLKSPRSSIFGGVVAAPVFSDLMGYTLRKEGVPPSDEPVDQFPLTW